MEKDDLEPACNFAPLRVGIGVQNGLQPRELEDALKVRVCTGADAGMGMVTVVTIGKVRHVFLVKGKSIKRNARELRLARNTVQGIVHGEVTERRYVRADQPLPQLGGFAAALDEMLSANAGKAKRDQLTFQRMYEELRLSGYGGGYDAVRRYGRAWEKRHCERSAEAYVPLSFAWGKPTSSIGATSTL